MSDLERLQRFLRTDPRDVGCDEAMAVLHISVDLAAAGQDVAGPAMMRQNSRVIGGF